MAQNHRVLSASVRETSREFGSLPLQLCHELNVLIAAPGQIYDDRIVWRQVAREANRGQNGMCCLQGRNDALQFCADSKPFEGFCIACLRIFGSPTVVKERVLRADCRVIKAG